jgi:hypothetical protein
VPNYPCRFQPARSFRTSHIAYRIASEVAEPFGKLPDNLPLNALTRSFERSLLEQCGEELPAELTADRGYQLTLQQTQLRAQTARPAIAPGHGARRGIMQLAPASA